MPFAAAKRGHGAYLQNPHFTFDSNSNVATKRHIKHKMKDKQKRIFCALCAFLWLPGILSGSEAESHGYSHEVGERVGLHLLHCLTSMSFHRDLADA